MSDLNAKLVQLIQTDLATRGKGTASSPIRVVTQFWDPQTGALIMERDSTDWIVTVERMSLIRTIIGSLPISKDGICQLWGDLMNALDRPSEPLNS